MVIEYDMQFKEALRVNHLETAEGLKKSYLINADVMQPLIQKLRDSGLKPGLDVAYEIRKMNALIQAVRAKEGSKIGQSQYNAG